MLRACWLLDPQWVSSNDTVKKCTCAEESPDFDVNLPAFMDFSPTELPTTGGMTTGMTTASETSSSTASATQTTNATTLRETTSTGWSLRTVTTVTQHAQEAAENSASTLKDSRLMLIATSSSGGACVLLLLFTLFIFLIYKGRERKQSNRDIDVIPVTNEEGSFQGTPIPGDLKRQLAGPGGNNNPTLTESQDKGIDGSANSSSTNGVATNTVVTLTDTTLKGDPV
eukprot:XP_003728697.1 PREDICTED: uncharacterized protein LOC100888178 isoform X2 [Strongylocentrotus purpuratus]